MKNFLIILCFSLSGNLLLAQSDQSVRYEPDLGKSSMKWLTKDANAEFTGTMRFKEGGYILMNDEELEQAVMYVDVQSISCVKCLRDVDAKNLIDYVKSKEFLNAQNMDYALFKMYSSEKLSDDKRGNYKIKGKITIIGYSNDIEIYATITEKKGRLFLEGSMPLNRVLWNLKDPLDDEGQPLYSMEQMVNLSFTMEAEKK